MAAIGVAACCHPIRAVAAATRAAGAFTFAQWNIGHFAMGRASDTKIRPDESAARLAQYRKLVDRIDADFIGINEYSAKFDLAGTDARSAVFGKYTDFRAGPHLGYKCNAVASRTAPLKSMRIGEFSRRMRRAYYMVCESEIDGRTDDDKLELSDHRMLLCRLGIPGGRGGTLTERTGLP